MQLISCIKSSRNLALIVFYSFLLGSFNVLASYASSAPAVPLGWAKAAGDEVVLYKPSVGAKNVVIVPDDVSESVGKYFPKTVKSENETDYDVKLLNTIIATLPVAPTITRHPENNTASAGATTTFSVTAASDEPLSYQWQRSDDNGNTWRNVGTDSATYSFTTQTSDKGALFRVEVIDINGGVLSRSARLWMGDPIIITTAAELDAMRENLNENYILGNDIDLSAYLAPGGEGRAKWGSDGWMPIGKYETSFTGNFNGNGHVITGLWIERFSTSNLGLFGYSNYAEIRNLGVEIATVGIRGNANNIGGLVGNAVDSRIENCFSTGNLIGSYNVGGLVGNMQRGSFENCYTTGNTSGQYYVGGLVGAIFGDIENCYATGDAQSESNAGGLVGSQTGNIANSCATGNVSGVYSVGGLVGYQQDNKSITSASYATGNVSGVYSVGGLVGGMQSGGVTSCYATGYVNGQYQVGGLVGNQFGAVGSSYAAGNVSVYNDVGELASRQSSDDYIFTITSSYAIGNVIGSSDVGGLVGFQQGASIIANSCATGDVIADSNAGGLSGVSNGNIENCYATGNVEAAIDNVGGLVGWHRYSNIIDCCAIGNAKGNDNIGGLVGYQLNSNITNSFATNNINGHDYVGGLVGYQRSGSIEDSSATGNVNGRDSVGGLAGYSFNSSNITNSCATGDVSGYSSVGGLMGKQQESNIENSFATGDISGSSFIGGLIGWQQDGDIENCYATGDIAANVNCVGGLIGYQEGGSIENSYATGNIAGDANYAGGLAGYSVTRSNIVNCYVAGNVNGGDYTGGLVGLLSNSVIANSYRYMYLEVNGVVIPTSDPESAPDKRHGGVKTALELMTKTTYTDNDWLFDDSTPSIGPWYWDNRGFPKLNMGTENFPFGFDPGVPMISIITQPAPNTIVTQGNISGDLSVSASVTQGATLTYQWYRNTIKSNAGGSIETGAEGASFVIPTTLTAAESPYYFYCVMSAPGAVSVPSNVATVAVNGESIDRTAVLKAGFQLRSIPSAANIENLMVKWISGNAVISEETVTTDQNGEAEIIIPSQNSELTIWVKGERTIAASYYVGTIENGSLINIGTLLGGDSNGDNMVDINDFNVFSYNYGKNINSPGFNRFADFNNDGVIDINDYNIFLSNYGKKGAQLPAGYSPSALSAATFIRESSKLSVKAPDSGGGCNAGMTAFALLMLTALPLFRINNIYKKKFSNIKEL